MTRDFIGWDFGGKVYNRIAWYDDFTFPEFGKQAQELIEGVLPGIRVAGEDGVMQVALIRTFIKHLSEAGELNRHLDWLEESIKMVFRLKFDSDYIERFAPAILHEKLPGRIQESSKTAMTIFENVEPTIDKVVTDVASRKTDIGQFKTNAFDWNELLEALEEVKSTDGGKSL